MSEQTEPLQPDSAPPATTAAAATTEPIAPTPNAPAEPSAPAPVAASAARRTVTLPLLPLGIIGGVIVALLFFGGGVAIGYGVASHDVRSDNAQQYRNGNDGPGFGGDRNGFAPGQKIPGQNQGGQNQGGQNQGSGDRATTAPRNG